MRLSASSATAIVLKCRQPKWRIRCGSARAASASLGKEREKNGYVPTSESSGDDAFQVYFGDLPSPRMIEVVKAKEVQLPSWRALPKRDDAADAFLRAHWYVKQHGGVCAEHCEACQCRWQPLCACCCLGGRLG